MGKLILVRHGESTGNKERVYATKPHELALTEEGERQAREAGAKIAQLFQVEAVVSSVYVRARETARIIAEVLGLPTHVEQNLHERHAGTYMGKPYESMLTAPDRDPKQPWLWRPPEGESLEDVRLRAAPVVERLAAEHPTRDVVIVSHGGVMLGLWAHFSGSWQNSFVPINCAIVVVEHHAGRFEAPTVIGDQRSAEHTGG